MQLHGIQFDDPTSRSIGRRAGAANALRNAHLRIALVALATLVPAGGLLGGVPIATQLAIVALPIASIGVLHGGLDPWVGDRVIRHHLGRSSPVLFYGAYLALIAAVIGCWVLFPLPTLTGFLLLSILHFGEQDAAAFTGRRDGLAMSVYGAIPVLGPIAAHPAEVARIFDWLTGIPAAQLAATVSWVARPLTVLWLIGAGMLLARFVIEGARDLSFRVFGLVVLLACMVSLPPLVAFAAYFCLLHSFGHLFDLAADDRGPWRRWSLARWAGRAWPATLGALSLGLLGWLVLSSLEAPDPSLHESMARAVFCGLAALTVPHVLLHEMFRRVPGR